MRRNSKNADAFFSSSNLASLNSSEFEEVQQDFENEKTQRVFEVQCSFHLALGILTDLLGTRRNSNEFLLVLLAPLCQSDQETLFATTPTLVS